MLGCKLSQQHAGRCKPCYGPEVYVSRILVVLTGQEWTLVTAPLRSSASAYMSTASATLAITLLFKLPVHVLFGTGSLLAIQAATMRLENSDLQVVAQGHHKS